MEYVYAALLLNEAGAEINEKNLTGVMEGAGLSVDESRVKALIAALEDVDIDEAVEQAQAVSAGAGGAPAPAEGGGGEPAAAEEAGGAGGAEEEADEEDEEAGEGLGELFG